MQFGRALRPDELRAVHFVIDQLDSLNKNDEHLKNKLDLKNIGLAGHSFGAHTTMLVAGAHAPQLKDAAALADDHVLRAYDSVHLAAAEAVSILTRDVEFRFAVFDVRLRRAATALGLAVLES